jgi:hypothetical protein
MVGSIRSQGGEKHIMIFNIYPVTDLNAITEHLLSVIYIGLKAEQMQNAVSIIFIFSFPLNKKGFCIDKI